MRYVVGYQPDDRGADAVRLAVAIARSQGTGLDIVYVLPAQAPYLSRTALGTSIGSGEELIERAGQEAVALVPHDVPAAFRARTADSSAEGLTEAAEEAQALLVGVGAAGNGLFKRATVGSVAGALLHASPVPVALAPRGSRRTEPVTRLAAFIGERPAAQAARDVAINAARRRGLPLRLVSIVALGVPDPAGTGGPLHQAHLHASSVLAEAATRIPDHLATVQVAHGRTIEEAIDSLDWDDGELVIIGSSRLAQKNRLFLGATANKVLRALPVPMVVVPRDHQGGLEGLKTS
ncbi:universal stress protein [Arthrobacter deserti]|uniref:Universal stress protein n=1 Tax=Arthrobacter deserti TaxID=1742687 RepID=A0ABX1JNP0_9MICC|nr:universal stress protein [Arthrobacter deserti]